MKYLANAMNDRLSGMIVQRVFSCNALLVMIILPPIATGVGCLLA